MLAIVHFIQNCTLVIDEERIELLFNFLVGKI